MFEPPVVALELPFNINTGLKPERIRAGYEPDNSPMNMIRAANNVTVFQFTKLSRVEAFCQVKSTI